jgi:uncharacterized protein (UPF0335 family)
MDEASKPADEINPATRDQLASFIQKIEDGEADRAKASEHLKSVYAEAAGCGFDKKALRQLIKDRKADSDKSIALRRVVRTYRKALGSLSGTPLGDWARGWIAEENRDKQPERQSDQEPLFASFMARRHGEASKPAEDDGPSAEAEEPPPPPPDEADKDKSARKAAKRTADKYIKPDGSQAKQGRKRKPSGDDARPEA